jgi:glycosyltransferase involved in cell wall biosynthesis
MTRARMNNTYPLVSIGLPVFNGAKFLRRALDSLQDQAYANFEIIISDNASTDETESVCREYAARDSCVRYIRQPENLGSHKNFNFVLQEARGEYFMWAADDDQWEPEYVQSMVTALEKDVAAVGAFSPYVLIEEETGNVFGDVKKINYESANALLRLTKFSWHYNDACIYGLMRREFLEDKNFIKFEPWAWINSSTPYNIAYPMLYYLLAKGNILLVGEKPLWMKSVTVKPRHHAPFLSKPAFGYLAHVIRKINLAVRSARYIYLASKSITLVLLTIPLLLARLTYDCITPIYAALYIWSHGKKISDFSPHEIWRLGVR